MFRSLIFIAGIVAGARAFSKGAPIEACNSLTPDHHAPIQEGPSPFAISIDKESIHPEGFVNVTLEGLGGETFKGFLVQARVGDKIVGSFEVDPNDPEVQTIDCPNGTKNAATHRNAAGKPKVSIIWVAPKDLQGVVVFKASFVKDGHTYWVAQPSSNLTIRL